MQEPVKDNEEKKDVTSTLKSNTEVQMNESPKKEMTTRVKMLKVKIKSLAAEARIIRLEESRSTPGGVQQCELHQHRVRDVRHEQRCSLLAYAFLRGRTLAQCEKKSKTQPDWQRVLKIVEKFGSVDGRDRMNTMAAFMDWKNAKSETTEGVKVD